MKLSIHHPRIADLPAGTFFTTAGKDTIYMALGKADNGKRSVVNMTTFEHADASASGFTDKTYVGEMTLHIIPATMQKDN